MSVTSMKFLNTVILPSWRISSSGISNLSWFSIVSGHAIFALLSSAM